MYLADHDIAELLSEMSISGPNPAHPFDPDGQIQPCSIDLRISDVFWKPSRRRRIWRRLLPGSEVAIDLRRADVSALDPLRDWKRYVIPDGQYLTIRPGQVVMGRIYERFRVPEGYAGKVEGRSSYARLGLAVHCTGDFINPGWEGYMPLQLCNFGPYPLRVVPYVSVCQLMLVRLSRKPDRTYGNEELKSKYVNDDGGPSLWWRDARVKEIQKGLGTYSVAEAIQQQIVATVRFESPDVLERLQRYIDHQRSGQIENVAQVMHGFARQEDRRRSLDRIALGAPVVLLAGLFASLFVAFGPVHVVLIIATVISGIVALGANVRRDSGYLGGAELRELEYRPDGESS
jgi:deoxycytidine triphosphate deaminase